tara:strand:+ start:342 stop:599 length:258 start_codon:yes stop_codon:yes gene_type:complete
MAKRDPNQISMRLDEDVNELLEQLRQDSIAGQLQIREEIGADRYDCHHGKPTPPTRPELCKRILQQAIREKAASPGRSLTLVVDG